LSSLASVHTVTVLWAGAFQLQQPAAAQDSVVRIWDSLSGRFIDSVVVRSPLPDPLVPLVQWIFQRPSWVMISGIVLAIFIALAAIVIAWRRRRRIRIWFATKDRGVKLAVGAALGAVLLIVVG
jgi:hypothetical protein